MTDGRRGGMTRQLFDYGIHNEASNIRAHVGVLAKTLFVFPTIEAVRVMHKFRTVKAFQPGCDFPTAEGKLAPPNEIPNLRAIPFHSRRCEGFEENLSTSEKGDRAVQIVSDCLKCGRFPLWLEGEFVHEKEIQITGTDLVVVGRWKIEVKCDFKASVKKGEPHERCTGHLFLQTAECNPKKLI